ncbi:hypothetical protein NliqN6_0644 [Naganishia liquefaciens]|uniref:Glycosyltransferase 2-like domain-containing protein n=1 Tax=Naganishia liquefaciens TaxID=104408 RepID=A0A8H3TNA8_9TREE|nr:hypothetical protein NliqN6_0644 [Naganishia liquefaciens]
MSVSSFRRRLSSIIAPFTVAAPSIAPPDATNRTRRGSSVPWNRGAPDHSEQNDTTSTDVDWDRKSYDLSEAASRQSFDLSASEAASDSETHQAYSDSSGLSSDTNSEDDAEIDDKYDLMTSHLYQVAEGKGWFRSSKAWGNSTGIVSIRVRRREFRTHPRLRNRRRRSPAVREALRQWEQAICLLNPEVALRISSKVVQAIMARADPNAHEIVIDVNTRIQVLDEISHLAGARKHQCAAFIRSENCLVVWTDEVETVIESAEALEKRMIHYVWTGRHQETKKIDDLLCALPDTGDSEKTFANVDETIEDKDLGSLEEDLGRGEGEWSRNARRPVMLYAPLISGLAIILNCVFTASGMRNLIKQALLDHNLTRFALIATVPFGFLLATFFCICVVGNVWQMIGPIAHFRENSTYYSGKAPVRMTGTLPQITIMMPVYKEGLEGVIIPTVESLKVAMGTYERQGGSVNIVICDDGMQIWEEEEAERRKAYYERNNIGWCARPKHNHEGFIRKGKFKKASNMNFTNRLSLRVEEIMDELHPQPPAEDADFQWSHEDEQDIYERALARAIEETNGLAWASGNIRIGEIILIIDSDTRVPTDCFLDAASEMHWAPELSIIQHESSVMQVIEHYFENGITSFTTRINSAISFCVTNGEVSPFIGHNAFLRWSALQDAAFIDPDDGITKQWNEACVSEDFDLSLRIQMRGWTMRWASYSNGGFAEGVSLTAVDELNRWQKYAYGCSEMLFNPFSKWFSRGPINKLFRMFIWSDIPIHSKISTLAYISSYYAIACAFPLSSMNWILMGLFHDSLDAFYLQSWNVFLTCIVIFCGLSNISSAIFQYRLKQNSLGGALIGNFKWLFFFFFFFCGLSYHLSTALLSHLTGYDMSWAMTEKEVDFSNFFKEVPAILRRFWTAFIPSFLVIIGCGVLASSYIPEGYRIQDFTAILPAMTQAGSHILYPIVLNPWLMHFSF